MKICQARDLLVTVAVVCWCSGSAADVSAQSQTLTVATEPQLQAAMRQVASNTTIVLAPGVYRLTSTLYFNGALSNVVIRGATANRDDVVLQGPGMRNGNYGNVPHGIWTGGGVNGITIANLTIRDVYFHPLIFNGGTQRPYVSNVHLIDAGEQFIKSNPSGASGVNDGIVEFSLLEYSGEARSDYTNGVDVHTGQNWVIRNNVFRNITSSAGLAGPAVLMWNASGNTLTERNLFLNCARGIHYGLIDRAGSDHSGGIIRNNIFFRSGNQSGDVGIGVYDSPGTQVLNNTVFVSGTYPTPIEYRFGGASGVVLTNNLLDGTIGRRDGATGTERNTLRATAGMFVNSTNGDLHLAAGSAAIDRGVMLTEVTDDWDGDIRPQGGAADIGADEYRAGTAVPATPTDVRVSVGAQAIVIAWTAPATGVTPTAYRLDFRSGPALVATVVVGTMTSTTLAVPAGVQGTFSVTVTAVAGGAQGPASAAATFTIGGCAGPPATPANLAGRVTAGTASVSWNAVAGAVSYVLQAGSFAGASNLFNGNVGALTSVSASGLPPGFRAFVRVIAIDACGQTSAPAPDLLIQ
jgi:hypothetical protein